MIPVLPANDIQRIKDLFEPRFYDIEEIFREIKGGNPRNQQKD
jgi:hypothetical protein